MNFLIIAAGEGSRLRQEGIAEPKPMIELKPGLPMIGRLAGMMLATPGAGRLNVIVNEEIAPIVRPYLEAQPWADKLKTIVKSTPSSMHSFYELSRALEPGKFVLTTVDTIMAPADFNAYVEAFENSDADGLMAVTPFVDDEKPLWVSVRRSDGCILAFSDARPADEEGVDIMVSGGVYGLSAPKAVATLERCMAAGKSRMRNYQRALLEDGLDIRAFVIDKIMDVDHAADLQKARDFAAQY